jgi:hypothetical protein
MDRTAYAIIVRMLMIIVKVDRLRERSDVLLEKLSRTLARTPDDRLVHAGVARLVGGHLPVALTSATQALGMDRRAIALMRLRADHRRRRRGGLAGETPPPGARRRGGEQPFGAFAPSVPVGARVHSQKHSRGVRYGAASDQAKNAERARSPISQIFQ